ncbi:MAG: hypothetical protein ABR577_09760 [Pyrinomonadaceae bacterium]
MRRINFLAIPLAAILLGACSWGAGSSPTATMKEFNTAMRKKDKEAVKRMLSRASLQTIEVDARLADETLDDAIQTGLDKTPADLKLPEMRNEVIKKDDTAFIEVKDEEKKVWFPVKFVKEEGRWKIAYDYAMRDPSHKARGRTVADATSDK